MKDDDDLDVDIERFNKLKKKSSSSLDVSSSADNNIISKQEKKELKEREKEREKKEKEEKKKLKSSSKKINTSSNGDSSSSSFSSAQLEISTPSGFKQTTTPPIPSALTKPSIFTLIQSPVSDYSSSNDDISNNNNNNNNNEQYIEPEPELEEPEHYYYSGKKEKLYYKVSPQLLQDVLKWEEKKTSYQKAIDGLLKKKTQMLDLLFNDYLEEMIPILDQHNFDAQFKNEIIGRERERLEASKLKLFGSGNASITALETQISQRKKEINMHNKITLIQSVVRGWLQKRRYQEMKKRIERRNKCVLEIIETERTYVNSLNIIMNQFLAPLQTIRKDLLSQSEISSIFSNCSSLQGIHQELLESLEKKWKNWDHHQSTIADSFQPLIPYLKLYIQYINNFNNAINTLNDCKKRDSKVNQFFFKDCKNNVQLKNKDFLDLQIQPVQRIPRYKLLLMELLKNTPTIHKDFDLITKALRAVQDVASSINESKRNAEGLEKMIQIQASLIQTNIELVQPYRRHLKDGIIMFEKRGVLKERVLFLFNDSLLLCKKRPNIMSGTLFDTSPRYSIATHLKLASCIVLPTEQPQHSLKYKDASGMVQNGSSDQTLKSISYGFAVLGREHLYFYTKNAIEQLEWIELIKGIVKEIDRNHSTLRKEEAEDAGDQMLVRESHSRLSTMIDGSMSGTVPNPNRLSTRIIERESRDQLQQQQQQGPIVIERTSRNSSSPPNNNTLLASSLTTQQVSSFSSSSSSLLANSIGNTSPPLQQQQSFGRTSNLSTTFSTISLLQQSSSSSPPLPSYQNKSIRELIDIIAQLNDLYQQLFSPLDSLQSVFSEYIKHIQSANMNQTLANISTILNKIVGLKRRSVELMREENLTKQLQDVIVQGKENIGAYNEWVKRAHPNPNDPASQQPRFLVINLMKWYNTLHGTWRMILDFDSSLSSSSNNMSPPNAFSSPLSSTISTSSLV
ncbi:pleckstrin domain-containing protein [Cavenderia fasciculata]|uniref:Pleckstrin domain-containing protein n=1 Tax=Cavenderia fasciculata TaxID=261658 RepID=F4PJB0_CACFS|nr:pleckstrin domain-containing protein [Cavenderia fasciculata]EGG24396.1 pleckstrin domain-containing protein [Cavenderia fasciculata]|eukprot:XP_004362247.1 pleckstrin domain-containing protein [Cavenderia fasciculata]